MLIRNDVTTMQYFLGEKKSRTITKITTNSDEIELQPSCKKQTFCKIILGKTAQDKIKHPSFKMAKALDLLNKYESEKAVLDNLIEKQKNMAKLQLELELTQ